MQHIVVFDKKYPSEEGRGRLRVALCSACSCDPLVPHFASCVARWIDGRMLSSSQSEDSFIDLLRNDNLAHLNLRVAAAKVADPIAGSSGFEGQGTLPDACAICEGPFFATVKCIAKADKKSTLFRSKSDRDYWRRLRTDGSHAPERLKKYKWGPKCCPKCCSCIFCLQRVYAHLRGADESDGDRYSDGGFNDYGGDGGFNDYGGDSPARAREGETPPGTPRLREEKARTPVTSPLRLPRTDAKCLQEHVDTYVNALFQSSITSSSVAAYAHNDFMFLPRCRSGDNFVLFASETFGRSKERLVLTSDPYDLVCVIKKTLAPGNVPLYTNIIDVYENHQYTVVFETTNLLLYLKSINVLL